MSVVLILGSQRQEDPKGLLASQYSYLPSTRFSEKFSFKKEVRRHGMLTSDCYMNRTQVHPCHPPPRHTDFSQRSEIFHPKQGMQQPSARRPEKVPEVATRAESLWFPQFLKSVSLALSTLWATVRYSSSWCSAVICFRHRPHLIPLLGLELIGQKRNKQWNRPGSYFCFLCFP